MSKVSLVLFAAVGVVNGFPLLGLVLPASLERVYRVELAHDNLVLLLRHRAISFGVVAGLIFAALLRPELRTAATVVALVSMGAFVVLVGLHGTSNPALRRIALIDGVAIVALVAAQLLARSD